eukprot:832630-Pyramimonas_sp.AAC.1
MRCRGACPCMRCMALHAEATGYRLCVAQACVLAGVAYAAYPCMQGPLDINRPRGPGFSLDMALERLKDEIANFIIDKKMMGGMLTKGVVAFGDAAAL